MKKNLVIRIISFILCSFMILSFCVLCYADENLSLQYSKIQDDSIIIPASPDDSIVVDYSFDIESSTISSMKSLNSFICYREIPANGNVEMWPLLENWGFTKRFVANSSSDSTTGALWLYLYDPSGNLRSDDWAMGTDEATYWDIWWPQTGTWTLRVIASGTNGTCHLYAGWN